MYMAELQARKKRNDEDWASFGDALRVLADKPRAPRIEPILFTN